MQSGKQGGFKKKNNNNYRKSEPNTEVEYLKGLGYSIGPNVPAFVSKNKGQARAIYKHAI